MNQMDGPSGDRKASGWSIPSAKLLPRDAEELSSDALFRGMAILGEKISILKDEARGGNWGLCL